MASLSGYFIDKSGRRRYVPDMPSYLVVPLERSIRRSVSNIEPNVPRMGSRILRQTESDIGQALSVSRDGSSVGSVVTRRSAFEIREAPYPDEESAVSENKFTEIIRHRINLNSSSAPDTHTHFGLGEDIYNAQYRRRASDIGILPVIDVTPASPDDRSQGPDNEDEFNPGPVLSIEMAGLDINGFQFRPGQAFYPGQNYELHMTGFGGNPSPYILGSDGQFYVKIQSPVNATPYSLQNREMTRPAKFSDREISRSTSAEIERRDSVQDPNSKKKPFTRGIEASVLVTQQNWRVVKDNVNQPLDGFNEYTRFYIIKSNGELDVFSALKYGIWTSTELGNKRLDKGIKENYNYGPVLLFFSVNGSGRFCGVAEMTSRVDQNCQTGVWTEPRWKGRFDIKWLFVKDIPMSHLRHIIIDNNYRKDVSCSRDTQELLPEAGFQFLHIFNTYRSTSGMIYDSNKGMMEAATCNFQRLIFPYQPGMPPLPRPLPSNIDGPAGFPRANGAEYNGYEAGNRYNNLNSQSRYNRHRNPRTGHPSRYNRHLGSNSHDIDRNGQHGLIPSTDNSSGVNSHTKDAVDGSEKYIRNLPNHSRGSRAGQNNRRQDYSYSRGSNPADYREYVGSLEASAKRATRARQNSILISAHIPETTDYGL